MRRPFPWVLWAVLSLLPRHARGEVSVRLEGIDVASDEARIKTDRPARHREFFMGEPPRLVVELRDTAPEPGVRALAGAGRWLKAVRAGQFTAEPAVTRVVLDLNARARYRVWAEGATLTIRLGVPSVPAASAGGPGSAATAEANATSLETPGAAASRAPRASAPRSSPAVPLPTEDGARALSPTAGDMILLGVAGLLFAGLLLRGASARSRAPGGEPGSPGAALETHAEMVEGLQEAINHLSRRVSILEKKMAEVGPAELGGGADAVPADVREELAEVRALVRSMVKSLQRHPASLE